MNIHNIINARSWEDTRRIREQFGMKPEQTYLAPVSITLKGLEYQAEYLSRPQYYCHECSSEYRQPVYHRDGPDPHDRLKQYKRTTLIRASKIQVIETSYPHDY